MCELDSRIYVSSQQDALLLYFILVKNPTCFVQIYCPSSAVLILYSQQLVFVKLKFITKIKLRNCESCWPLRIIRFLLHVSAANRRHRGAQTHMFKTSQNLRKIWWWYSIIVSPFTAIRIVFYRIWLHFKCTDFYELDSFHPVVYT